MSDRNEIRLTLKRDLYREVVRLAKDDKRKATEWLRLAVEAIVESRRKKETIQ